MWVYVQKTGELIAPDGEVLRGNYSGLGVGKNNPDAQHVVGIGPIPRGRYFMGAPFDSPEHGPHCIRLTPDAANEMFGRRGFLVHGDSISAPGMASKGCIIASRSTRLRMGAKRDVLEVIADRVNIKDVML